LKVERLKLAGRHWLAKDRERVGFLSIAADIVAGV
jgi:hypothetical protein